MKISDVACVEDLYGTNRTSSSHERVDDAWERYENNLADAINQLCNATSGLAEAKWWLRTMVPFVAGLFVRGTDWIERYERRLSVRAFTRAVGSSAPSNNSNMGRLFELQRLLAPVTAAQWLVGQRLGDPPIATNDVGFTYWKDASDGSIGFAIPLTPDHVLGIRPRRECVVLRWRRDSWYGQVLRKNLVWGEHDALNLATAAAANRYVFASEQKVLSNLLERLQAFRSQALIEPVDVFGLPTHLGAFYALIWHRLISVLPRSPQRGEIGEFSIHVPALGKDRVLPLLIPSNPCPVTGGLTWRRESILLSLEDDEAVASWYAQHPQNANLYLDPLDPWTPTADTKALHNLKVLGISFS